MVDVVDVILVLLVDAILAVFTVFCRLMCAGQETALTWADHFVQKPYIYKCTPPPSLSPLHPALTIYIYTHRLIHGIMIPLTAASQSS